MISKYLIFSLIENPGEIITIENQRVKYCNKYS